MARQRGGGHACCIGLCGRVHGVSFPAIRRLAGFGCGREPGADRQPAETPVSAVNRALPPDAPLTILVGSYPKVSADPGGSIEDVRDAGTAGSIGALTEWLETSGYAVYYADADLGPKGRWQRVLVGAYTDPQVAQREADRLNAVVPGSNARVIEAASAGRLEN